MIPHNAQLASTLHKEEVSVSLVNSPVRPQLARQCTNGWSMRAHLLMTISFTHVCTQCYMHVYTPHRTPEREDSKQVWPIPSQPH